MVTMNFSQSIVDDTGSNRGTPFVHHLSRSRHTFRERHSSLLGDAALKTLIRRREKAVARLEWAKEGHEPPFPASVSYGLDHIQNEFQLTN